MRILHTSDWHLGRNFGAQPLLDDQRAFLEWLRRLVADERVELVLVAGDVFDRAIPSAEAVETWRDFLVGIHALGAQLVAIAGNHDHFVRLAAYDGLTDSSRIWVRGGHGRAGEVLEIEGADGPLAVVPVPFLDPLLARPLLEAAAGPPDEGGDPASAGLARPGGEEVASGSGGGPGPSPHELVLRAALDRARPRVAGRRSIAIAHAWVQGGTQSDSERMLSVGGAGQVDASLFDGFSYAALGHLHRPQSVGEREQVRYSGSPLAYSFSEEHGKEVVLLDMDAGGRRVHATPIRVEVGRPVATIAGTIDDLLDHPRFADATGAWVRAVLADPGLVLDAKSRLQKRFPHVVEVTYASADGSGELRGGASRETIETKSPLELAVEFWQAVEREDPDEPTRELLRDALEHARLAREQA